MVGFCIQFLKFTCPIRQRILSPSILQHYDDAAVLKLEHVILRTY